ncbi:MAG: EAL domain-containing protein [Firmicutes bacterium]|nr:EAL domain-containing protein [Bacillota bacterium]
MRKKAILIILITVVVMYAVYYLYLRFTSPLHDFHDNMNLGSLFMLSFLIMLFGVELNNKKLYLAAFILMMFAVFEFLQHQFGLYEDGIIISKPFDIAFHFVNSMSLAVVAFAVYSEIFKHQKISQITSASYDQNEAIFIEYFKKTGKIKIEFSQQFQHTHALSYKAYVTEFKEFKSFVHEEDQYIFPYFENINQNTKINGAKFRLKFPSMDAYVFLYIRGSFTLEQRYIFIGFDVTDYENTQKSLEDQKVQYDLLEIESKKIIANTQSLIVKMDLNGKVVFASESFIKAFGEGQRRVVGENIFKLYPLKNRNDRQWFYQAIKEYASSDQSILTINHEKRYIFWKNDVLFDAFDKVEFVVSVGQDITEIVELNQKLDFQSKHDTLTGLLDYKGLYNMISMQNGITKAIAFFIEISNYSLIASYYGNEISDTLIKQVAEELIIMNINNHLIARYSSNQFVYIAINPTKSETQAILMRFQESVFTVYDVHQVAVQTKKNIGYAQYPDDTNNLTELIAYAILAMRESSIQVHNIVIKYEKPMSMRLIQNVSLAYELYQAISKSEIEVFFQKIVDVRSNQVVYIEALARWNDVNKGQISPDHFFDIAIQSNLIDQLDEYLVKKAIDSYAQICKNEPYKHAKLALNLSSGTFLRDDFIFILNAQIEKNQLKTNDIVIEVSENTFVHGFDQCNEYIKNYKKYGYMIAIDDFGSHYSSLSILDVIDYDLIKIDGSFISNMDSEKNNLIVQMIIKIAKLDGRRVIAEGVETKTMSDQLLMYDCFLHQGYYYHRPEKIDFKDYIVEK